MHIINTTKSIEKRHQEKWINVKRKAGMLRSATSGHNGYMKLRLYYEVLEQSVTVFVTVRNKLRHGETRKQRLQREAVSEEKRLLIPRTHRH